MSFSRYNPEDSVISSETVVRGLWSGDTNLLTGTLYTSTYTEYYLDVYKEDTEPLIEYYDKGSLTVKINAVGEVDDIYNLISKEF